MARSLSSRWTVAFLGALVGACASRPIPSAHENPPPVASSVSATSTASAPESVASVASGASMRLIHPTSTRWESEELAPRVVPVRVEPGTGLGLLVRATRPTAGGPIGWFLDAWRFHRLPNDLLVGTVPASLGGPRLMLVTPDDRFLPLDADEFLGVDPAGTVLLASEGGQARLFELPMPFDASSVPRPISVGMDDMPVPIDWKDESTRVLDRSHVLVGETSVVALPRFHPMPSLPWGFVEAVRGTTLLVRTGLGTDELRFELWRAGGSSPMLQLAPPTVLDFDPVGVPLWAVDLSPDGQQLGFVSRGVFVARTDSPRPGWKLISAHRFAPGRNGAGLTFSRDGAFLCVTEGNVSSVVPISGRPRKPAGTIELPMVTDAGVCEVFLLPKLPGLEPIPESHDRFLKNVVPHLVATDHTWIAALYRQSKASSTAASPVELIVAEPATGRLLRRVVVGARTEPGPMEVDELQVVRRAEPRVVVTWPGGSAPPDFGGTFDVRTGLRVDPVLVSDGAPEALGTYCLREDGAVFAEPECAGTSPR
jgi:hypothetical protein